MNSPGSCWRFGGACSVGRGAGGTLAALTRFTPMSAVRDNPAAQRYELEVDGRLAIAAYQRRGDVVAFTHTEVPGELEGQGVGSRLIEGALADVRARGLHMLPLCSFVAAYVARHPETRDLIAPE